MVKGMQRTHRCIVVGNQGAGGPWGFGQTMFRGYLGLSPFCVLLHFYATIFRTLHPRPTPLCASMKGQVKKFLRMLLLGIEPWW
jgi:hypothetical protein